MAMAFCLERKTERFYHVPCFCLHYTCTNDYNIVIGLLQNTGNFQTEFVPVLYLGI